MFSIRYTLAGNPPIQKTAWGVEKWSEMNEQQFLPAVRAILMSVENPAARYMLPLICSNISKEDYRRLSHVQSAQVMAAFDHLLEYKDLPTKWMIPKLKIAHIIENKYLPMQALYGPGDKLKNLVFEEFMYAESMIEKFKKDNNTHYLDQFVAILYRPKKRDKNLHGDVREAFNRHSVEERTRKIEKIDKASKEAIHLNYLGCKALLPKLYPALFSDSDPNAGAARSSFTWLDMAYRFVNHQPTELETFKKLNLHEVLASLNLKVKDDQALKAEIDAMRRKHSKK